MYQNYETTALTGNFNNCLSALYTNGQAGPHISLLTRTGTNKLPDTTLQNVHANAAKTKSNLSHPNVSRVGLWKTSSPKPSMLRSLSVCSSWLAARNDGNRRTTRIPEEGRGAPYNRAQMLRLLQGRLGDCQQEGASVSRGWVGSGMARGLRIRRHQVKGYPESLTSWPADTLPSLFKSECWQLDRVLSAWPPDLCPSYVRAVLLATDPVLCSVEYRHYC